MSVFRLVIPMTAMVVLAVSTPAAQTRPPAIPTCAGLTLVTAVNDATGDYESIKTVDGADDQEIRIKYSAQKMDFGDMFSTAKPTVRTYLSRRVVRREGRLVGSAIPGRWRIWIPSNSRQVTGLLSGPALSVEVPGRSSGATGARRRWAPAHASAPH